ncbi:hypothetical protein FR932_00330 [Moritella marina ATCC 15381]|uniref:Lipoprotein n=1 Tax=Moritella marina ATCC 15381 TaxID=1202962 RepID=A0A5J6WGS4_MORMI|nr:hypothetical protein [Moritella marina]QFI36370.1 hypothetical protein FR932_00330 [Moritella marina ATCC 15381]
MNKIVLIICLSLSLQACSNLGINLAIGIGDTSTTNKLTVPENKTKEDKKKNGLLAITQFMAVMALLKTQVQS